MKSESKTAKVTNSLWKVPLKPGRESTAIVAPLPMSPATPTMTLSTPSHTVLHICAEAVGISMHEVRLLFILLLKLVIISCQRVSRELE